MRYLIGFLIAIFLSGCTTIGGEKTAQIKAGSSVAPLSLMGNSAEIRFIGTTVFSNERRVIEVPEWQIDKYAEDVVARFLSTNRRFTVLQPDTSAVRVSSGDMTQVAAGDSKMGDRKTGILKLANDTGAEFLVVVWPALFGDPFFGTNQTFSGYGIYERSFLGIQKAVNFLTLKVSLINSKTGEEIARSSGFIQSPRVKENWMESDKLQLSAEDNQVTRQAIEQLMENLIKTLLGNLKLAN